MGFLASSPNDNDVIADNPNGGISIFARQSQLLSHDTHLTAGLGTAHPEHWPSDGNVIQTGVQSWALEGASCSEPLAYVGYNSHWAP